jgi:aerobic carbon-monoxide dehydrogenase large subunit
MQERYVGAAIRRREDRRLLTGGSQYVDDLRWAGCLYAVVARSPHAHARVVAMRLERARRHPAVVACFAFPDLADALRPLPAAGIPPGPLQARVGFRLKAAPQFPLARGKVRYVGEPVAILVALDRYAAEDALGLLEVDYEPLDAVTHVEQAVEPRAPLVHEEWGDNISVAFATGVGDPERAFAEAAVRVHERFTVPRCAGIPLEPRGILAVPDPRGLTVWASTQVPHWLQRTLAESLGLPPHRIRCVTPDVGGGFGTKCSIYPEDVLIPLVASRLHRPVKWTETRREHFQSATHSREQVHDAEIAATRDGVILGFRDRFVLDQGAYNPWGIVQPYNTVGHMLGPYRIKHAFFEVQSVVTNKTPHAPYRGAGRPEAVFVMDRILDLLARKIGKDPADIRRRNLIEPREMPYDVGLLYRDGNPLVYDGGDFPAALERALAAIGYDRVRADQGALRARGVFRGVGLSAYVEGTGIGPYEGAVVRLDGGGTARIATGACSQGQGHETTLAQIAADALGARLEDTMVIGGDTAEIPLGIGTFASRSIVLAGNAVARAARDVRRQVVRAAAVLLEAAESDLEVAQSRVCVRGSPSRSVTFAQVVQASLPTFQGPGVSEPVFEGTVYHTVPTVTFASAVHAALVDVDPETGAVTVLRYVVAHDCGRVVNPAIVNGQIHGGVAQGIGGGLTEEIVYDEAGQLLTASLMDYAIPRARTLPAIEAIHLESPSSRNPLGVKGIGEGGAISPPAALANAVEDALAPFGIRITGGPLTPRRIVALLAAAPPGESHPSTPSGPA